MDGTSAAWRAAAPALVAVALLVACGSPTEEADRPPPTTTPMVTLRQVPDPGEPGTLLDLTPVEGMPAHASAWTIAYASETADGEPITVTGLLVVPDGEPPPGGWPLVTWGHPTTGTSDRCTPSQQGPTSIHNVAELVDAGVAIVATDYEGLGVEGGHPYLVGRAEGKDVLDAVRAAWQVEEAGMREGGPVVAAGFSQGGHAVFWAAELAPTYAPEIELLGVQAVAPVSDVTSFAARAESYDEQFGVLVTILVGLTHAHDGLDLATVLTPEALDLLPVTESACIGEVVTAYTQPVDEMLVTSPLDDRAWRSLFDENLTAQVPLGVPVHVLQGAEDPIIAEAVTAELVERLCDHGDSVEYDVVPGVDHAVLTPERTVPWILDRFEGRPAADDC